MEATIPFIMGLVPLSPCLRHALAVVVFFYTHNCTFFQQFFYKSSTHSRVSFFNWYSFICVQFIQIFCRKLMNSNRNTFTMIEDRILVFYFLVNVCTGSNVTIVKKWQWKSSRLIDEILEFKALIAIIVLWFYTLSSCIHWSHFFFTCKLNRNYSSVLFMILKF